MSTVTILRILKLTLTYGTSPLLQPVHIYSMPTIISISTSQVFYGTNKHDNKYCYFIETIRFKLWSIECCQVQARLIVNQLMTEQIITAVRHHHIKESHGKKICK